MKFFTLFTEHPRSVGESYGEHMVAAAGFSLRLWVGALACSVHAVLPFLFVRTAGGIVSDLHNRMVVHRDRTQATMPQQDQSAPDDDVWHHRA